MPARKQSCEVDDDGSNPTIATYNAIGATYKVLKHVTTKVYADEGLTEAQLQTLVLLATEGPMLMRKLSDAMLVTPTNITGLVDRLEEKKLVVRTSSAGDRRATIIEITPEGRALQERMSKKKSELVQRALASFTKDEQKTLRSLLEKFQREVTNSLDEQSIVKIKPQIK
jgi:DNA-binding MarR family transcriptional regulator